MRALELLARPKADLQQAQRTGSAGVFAGVQRIHTPLGDIRYQHGNGTDSHPANLVRVERAGHSRHYHYEHTGWPHGGGNGS